MKKFLPLLLAVAALPLFQSCVAPHSYGVSYGTATNYGSSVGLIATSHARWGYDPFYRAWYDHSLGRYYDLNRGRYFTTLPRRYSSPFFPSYYNRGSVLRCPPGLPHLYTSFNRPSFNFITTGHNRWAYDPYRRCYFDHQTKRYFNHNAGRFYTSLPRRYSTPRYPSGYRSGGSVGLHSSLPFVNHRTHSSHRGHGSLTRDQRSYGHNRSSSNRGSRSVFTNGSSQRPSLNVPSYRSRTSVDRQSPSLQRGRTSLAPQPSRTTTRTQVAPQRQSRPSVITKTYTRDAARGQAQAAARAAAAANARAKEASSQMQQRAQQRSRRGGMTPARGGSTGRSQQSSGGRGSRGSSRGGRQIY